MKGREEGNRREQRRNKRYIARRGKQKWKPVGFFQYDSPTKSLTVAASCLFPDHVRPTAIPPSFVKHLMPSSLLVMESEIKTKDIPP